MTSLDRFDLPGDVNPGHPLRRCPRRALTASPHARDEEAKARWELRGKLYNQQTREVVGLLTAAGGGELTVAELAALARIEEFTVGEIIDSLSRRILLTWERGYYGGEQVHPFRTEALYSAAQQLLGADLERCRNRIHDWADTYRSLWWPATTPGYLLAPYASMLAERGNNARLAVLAGDAARHDLMLRAARSDGPALTEIDIAQQLTCAASSPDFAALTRMAMERFRLAGRNGSIPERLPAVWGRLGDVQHARELADSIPDPEKRDSALRHIDDEDDAEPDWRRAVQTIGPKATPLFGLPAKPPSFPDFFGAGGRALSRGIAPRGQQATGDDEGRTEALVTDAVNAARSAPDPVPGLSRIAEALASTNLALAADIAEEAARGIRDPRNQALALAHIAFAVAATDSARAVRLLKNAVASLAQPALSQGTSSYPHRAQVLAAMTRAIAAIGSQRAARLADDLARGARSLSRPRTRARELALIAEILAAASPDQAVRLANEAARGARSQEDPTARAEILGDVAETLAAVYPAWAGRLADEADRADRAAHYSGMRTMLDGELVWIVWTLASLKSWDAAEQAAHAITDPKPRTQALTALAEAIVSADPPRAARLAEEAEAAARLSQESYRFARRKSCHSQRKASPPRDYGTAPKQQ